MPLYEYQVVAPARGCPQCAAGFETLQRLADAPLTACPHCGAAVARRISAPAVAPAGGDFYSRAGRAGLRAFKRRDRGVYEKIN